MNAEAWCSVVHHRPLVLAGLAAVDCAALAAFPAISFQRSALSPHPAQGGEEKLNPDS